MKHENKLEKLTQQNLSIVASVLGIILFYAWLASAGNGSHPGTTTYYHAYLAEAFLHGNLHLFQQPDPSLLAVDNPYSLPARMEVEKIGVMTPVDFSLYEGKFYLYWGPVPALLLAVIQFFSPQQVIGDFVLAFVFGVGIFLVQCLLLLALWEHFFINLPKWTFHLALFVAGLAWPVSLLRHGNDHARVYEAAIAAGQFFLIAGLFVAFIAISRPTISPWRLLLAGLFWALAIGSRHILAAPIGFMVLMTTLWIIRFNTRATSNIVNILSLGLPLALGAVGLGWYNWARFGSITETGFFYALAGVDIQEHYSELFSGSYIIQNLYNYILNPPGFQENFPFVSMIKGSNGLILPFYAGPDFYYAQPMTGLFYIFPFAVFAFMALTVFFSRMSSVNHEEALLVGRENRFLSWLILNLSGSLLIAFLLLMFFFWAGMRYAGDFLPLLTILSALGFWQGYPLKRVQPWVDNSYVLSGFFLAIVSIVISVLLSISTMYG